MTTIDHFTTHARTMTDASDILIRRLDTTRSGGKSIEVGGGDAHTEYKNSTESAQRPPRM